MKIGKLVQRNISAIFEYCETQNRAEFARLQDKYYSKETFDINYPFCRPIAKISGADRVRYWQNEYQALGIPIRVTSQWFNPPTSKSLFLFRAYMIKHKIEFDDSPFLATEEPQKTSSSKTRGRYKASAIGNGQNAVFRYILGQLGDEQFSAQDWQQVVEDFGNCCAYCGAKGELVMDHIIPINKQFLGEHRLGNLAPACRGCNSKKASNDFRAFLSDDPARISTIESHMAKNEYTPIGDHKKLKMVLENAHREIRQLADRYVSLAEIILQEDEDQESPAINS